MSAPSTPRWVDHLVRSALRARAGVDPEGVHQVRVAARRLRALLELGARRALVGDLRWLVRSLSRARDLDVLRDALPRADPRFDAWRARLALAARADCAATLSSQRLEGLIAALRVAPPIDLATARRGLEVAQRRVQRRLRGLRAAGPAARPAAVHALRRSLRQWRYALEWLEHDAGELSQLQRALGAVCDVAALARLVREYEDVAKADVSDALARLTAAQQVMTQQVLAALDAGAAHARR